MFLAMNVLDRCCCCRASRYFCWEWGGFWTDSLQQMVSKGKMLEEVSMWLRVGRIVAEVSTSSMVAFANSDSGCD